jgi:cytochrome c-type biogenesis protein CcmH/NrfG
MAWPGRAYGFILASLIALVVAGTLFAGSVFGKRAGILTPAGESGAVRSFAARDWVLVAPFVNRTGDPTFDEVVELALERELVNSRFVNVVPRPRVEDVLALMKKPPDTRLDDALAREVAVRDGGIRVLLTGRIDRIGAAYELTTRILDPVDGRTLATISHDAERPSDILGTIRTQALEVRRALGETMASIERSREALARVTTPSLKALQLYSRAASLLNGEVWRYRPDAESRYASAEALLTDATALDPTFASAWLLLAHSIFQQDRPKAEYLPIAERALQLTSGVSDVERYFIEGYTHWRRGRDQEDPSEAEAAARAFEAVLQLSPDHYWTLLELVPVYRKLNRFADAERLVIHEADLRPRSVRFTVEAARVHMRRGERTQARAMIVRARAVAREDADNTTAAAFDPLQWMRLWEAHEAWVDNDPARALAAAQRAEQETADSTHVGWVFRLAYVYGGLGRFEDELRVAKRLPSKRYEWVRDGVNLARGRIAEVRQQVADQPLVVRTRGILCDEYLALRTVPPPRPVLVGPAEAEGEIDRGVGRELDQGTVEQTLPRKPVVMEAKTKKTVFLGQFHLALLNLRETKVIETELTRQTRLIMSNELRTGPRYLCPFGETFSPPFVILGNRMKLG